MTDTASDQRPTRLGRAVIPRAQRHPGLSGLLTLEDGVDAFAARYLLAQLADSTLDVQYYIWEPDNSGKLLFSALLEAADRGVKVRVLLDDNNTSGMDDLLTRLDAHPHIEVRLFNPFSFRTLRVLGYLTDFARLNRRMHNKSFTVDGQVTIVGGRNVGDAYFGVGKQPLFNDLDVMAVGKVVPQVTADFESYWNSVCVKPLSQVLGRQSSAGELNPARQVPHSAMAERYLERLRTTPFARQIQSGELPLIWAPAELLSDDPRKGQGRAARKTLLAQRFRNAIGTPSSQFDLISAYFVPTRAGVALLIALARRGVKIAILTNSLAANDVSVVHAGYARWRKKLLRRGIALYELKPDPQMPEAIHEKGLAGSSGSSLHAKTFSVDNKQIFIGSFNFDPRSAMLNTEMGLVIESENLAGHIHERFTQGQRRVAWALRLDRWGRINWIDEDDNGNLLLHKHEPQTRFWQRMAVRLASRLPIEWLL